MQPQESVHGKAVLSSLDWQQVDFVSECMFGSFHNC
jgi:hypothetical protein